MKKGETTDGSGQKRPLTDDVDLCEQSVDALKAELRLNPIDPHSFTQSRDQVRVRHMHLVLKVDFSTRQLLGQVELNLEKVNPECTHLLLDTDQLTISEVSGLSGDNKWLTLPHRLHLAIEFGSKLSISIEKLPANSKIRIKYETAIRPRGLVWLNEKQTASKMEMLFSENEPTGARSWLPSQDSPSVKATFSAEIEAPTELTVLMSGMSEPSKPTDSSTSSSSSKSSLTKLHRFKQTIPIPTYLLAIVVGAFEHAKLTDKSNLFCEMKYKERGVELLKPIMKEILPKIVEMLGEFPFSVVNLVILPPSFSAGGMKNPCLTFINHSMLRDHDDTVNLIAHEMAHSWFSDTITVQNWQHVWLNESFATFIGRKVLTLMDCEEERYSEERLGWFVLKKEVRKMKQPMVPDLRGFPADRFVRSPVVYEKGYLLLCKLEDLLTEDVFLLFVRKYIEHFKNSSITTQQFTEFFDQFQKANAKLDQKQIDWTQWMKSRDLNICLPIALNASPQMEVCLRLAEKWFTLTDKELELGDHNAELKRYERFPIRLRKLFLTELAYKSNDSRLSALKMKRLSEMYQLHKTTTVVRAKWIYLGLVNHWREILPLAKKFLDKHNAQITIAIYEAMSCWGEAEELARSSLKENWDRLGKYSAIEIDQAIGPQQQ